MKKRLTKRLVEGLTPGERDHVIWDADVAGFGLKVAPSGRKTFVLFYRTADGTQRKPTLGTFGQITVEQARGMARQALAAVATGADPSLAKRGARQAPTMSDLCDLYIETHLVRKRPSSQRNDRSLIQRFIRPQLGTLKVAAVRHSNVESLHRDISKATPTQANRLIALLSKMFEIGIKAEMRTDNPAKGVDRNPENARERYLSEQEALRLWEVLDNHPNQLSANIVRLLFLTGARSSEVFAATWGQFDLDRGVWTKPFTGTKQKKLHRVPLNADALALLRALQEESAGQGHAYVFPSRGKKGHLTTVKTFWASVCRAAAIAACRPHDLRHSFASTLASTGSSLPMIGAALGHSQVATTGRYSHLLDQALRQAVAVVGRPKAGGVG